MERFLSKLNAKHQAKNKMKTADEWDKEIIKITAEINQKYPELSKYLSEMPEQLLPKEDKAVSIKSLEIYHNSLVELLGRYSKNTNKKSQ